MGLGIPELIVILFLVILIASILQARFLKLGEVDDF